MKNKIKNLTVEDRVLKYVLTSLIIIGFLSLSFYIFFTGPVIFHSDSSMVTSLAKEQMETMEIFPGGWNYGTSIVFLEPLVLSLFSLFFGHTIFARTCFAFLLVILLFLLCAWIFKKEKNKTGWLFTLSLLASGVSPFFSEHMFGQASYLSGACITLTAILLSLKILETSWVVNTKLLSTLFILFLLIFLTSYAGLSNLIRQFSPFIATLVLLNIIDWKKRKSSPSQLENNQTINKIVLISIWLLSSVFGILGYWLLISSKGIDMESQVYFIDNIDDLLGNLKLFMDGLPFLFAGTYSGRDVFFYNDSLMSQYRLVFLGFLMFALPLFLFIRLNRIKNYYFRVFIVYYLFVLAATSLGYIATSAAKDITTSRYFIFPMFLSILLFGVFISENFIKRKTHLYCILTLLLPFYFNSYMQVNYPYGDIKYGQGKISFNKNSNAHSGITGFLRSKGLTYGYATFWNAGVVTSLSRWEVQVNPITLNRSGLPAPASWLSSNRWYESSNHKGKTFLLIADGEEYDFNFLRFFLGEPMNESTYPGYKILVYGFNLAEKLPGWPTFVRENKRLEYPLPESALNLFEHKQVRFFYGWTDFVERDKKVKLLTKNRGVSYIKNQGRNFFLQVKGFTWLGHGSKIEGLRVYFNDSLLGSFKVSENPNPFILHYYIKGQDFNGEPLAKITVEPEKPQLRGGPRKFEGVLIDSINVVSEAEEAVFFKGWREFINGEGEINMQTLDKGVVKIKNIGRDILLKVKGHTDVQEQGRVQGLRFYLNDELLEEIKPNENPFPFINHYSIEAHRFKGAKWASLRIELDGAKPKAVGAKAKGVFIDSIKIVDEARETIFYRGWREFKNEKGEVKMRSSHKGVVLLKNRGADIVLKVKGHTHASAKGRIQGIRFYLNGELLEGIKIKENPFPFINHYIIKEKRFKGAKRASLRIELDGAEPKAGGSKPEGVFIDEVKLLKNPDIVLFKGWREFINIEGKIKPHLRHNGTLYIKNNGKDVLLKIKGFTDASEGLKVKGLKIYINDHFHERLEIKKKFHPFINHYIIESETFENKEWAKLQIEVEGLELTDGPGMAESGLFLDEVKILQDQGPVFFNGWLELNDINGNIKMYAQNKGVVYIKNTGKNIEVEIAGFTDVSKTKALRFAFNGAPLDGFQVNKNPNPFLKAYKIEADRFKGKKWGQLSIEPIRGGLSDEGSEVGGVVIDGVKVNPF